MPTCKIMMYTLIPALTVLESMMYNMWWSSWPDFIDKLPQKAEAQIRKEDKTPAWQRRVSVR